MSEKLTRAQREALGRIVSYPVGAGMNLPASYMRREFADSTLTVLLNRGLIRFELGDYWITDAGRAALEDSP